MGLIKARTLHHRQFDYDRTFVTSTINSREWSVAWRDENKVIAFSCALTRKRFRPVCGGNFDGVVIHPHRVLFCP